MKIAADTNLLVRVIMEDDPKQSPAAEATLAAAEMVALPIVALCELVWVLSHGYGIASPAIAATLRRLIESSNVALDRPAVEAGLAFLDAGGDFADGVIAHEGQCLGAELFVSFDKKAVALLQAQGKAARLVL